MGDIVINLNTRSCAGMGSLPPARSVNSEELVLGPPGVDWVSSSGTSSKVNFENFSALSCQVARWTHRGTTLDDGRDLGVLISFNGNSTLHFSIDLERSIRVS
jgi:hypothetical protein